MLAQKDAQARGVHGAGAQKVGMSFRRDIGDAEVPEHAQSLLADGPGGHALHLDFGDVNAPAQLQRIAAAGDVEDGQLGVGQICAAGYARSDAPRRPRGRTEICAPDSRHAKAATAAGAYLGGAGVQPRRPLPPGMPRSTPS